MKEYHRRKIMQLEYHLILEGLRYKIQIYKIQTFHNTLEITQNCTQACRHWVSKVGVKALKQWIGIVMGWVLSFSWLSFCIVYTVCICVTVVNNLDMCAVRWVAIEIFYINE